MFFSLGADMPCMSTLSVLIGESDQSIIDCLVGAFNPVIGERAEVDAFATSSATELCSYANEHHVDLFILVLNNLLFSDGNMPPRQRIRQALQFVSDLKRAYGVPIIALAGWPNDPQFADRVLYAGADRFYSLPIRPFDLEEAVRQCLAVKQI